MADLRFAIRRLSKQPGATLVAILTLAFSIGAAAATWSLLSAVLLHPLPVHEPQRLVVAGLRITTGRDAGSLRTGFTYPYYPHLRDSGIFERVAAEWSPPLSLLVSRGALPRSPGGSLAAARRSSCREAWTSACWSYRSTCASWPRQPAQLWQLRCSSRWWLEYSASQPTSGTPFDRDRDPRDRLEGDGHAPRW